MLPRKCQAHRHRPVRLRRPAALLAVLLIAIGLGVAESAAALNQDDLRAASEIPVSSPAYGPLPVDPSCQHLPVADCIVQQGSPGSRRVLVVGDSHALFLVPPMLAIAKEKDLTLAVSALPGCPWQIGLVYVKSTHAACTAAKHVWYTKVIPEFQPDIILFATRASDHRGASKYAVMSTTPWLTADTQSGLLALATRDAQDLGRTRSAASGVPDRGAHSRRVFRHLPLPRACPGRGLLHVHIRRRTFHCGAGISSTGDHPRGHGHHQPRPDDLPPPATLRCGRRRQCRQARWRPSHRAIRGADLP